MQTTRMLRRRDVERMVGLSATTIYYLEKRGDFPAHFMLTPRCAVWDEASVISWLEARKAKPAEPAKGPTSPAMARRAAVGA